MAEDFLAKKQSIVSPKSSRTPEKVKIDEISCRRHWTIQQCELGRTEEVVWRMEKVKIYSLW